MGQWVQSPVCTGWYINNFFKEHISQSLINGHMLEVEETEMAWH